MKILVACTLTILYLTCISCDDSIKYAAIIYRHGDRTPVDPYPTDPWKDQSWWPDKFGELTNLGKFQHFRLGKWLTARYSHLLSEKFDPSEIYVRSTDVDRTLMSAQANLAGMYPPVKTSVWNPNLMWQPIPVHTTAEKDDNILAMKKYCSNYKLKLKEYISSSSYKEGLSKYNNLMDYMTKYTGRPIKNYSDIEYIYNTLSIEKLYNFTLPKWTDLVYPNKMREAACYSFIIPTAEPQLARLLVGPLLKEITAKMSHAVSENIIGKSDYLKLSVYSAHDDTVGSVLNALRMFDIHCPPYTSTILMELLQVKTPPDSLDDFKVRISYRNSTEIVEPTILTIPKCGQMCSLSNFIILYMDIMPHNWDVECGNHKNVLWGKIGMILLITVIAMACYALMKTRISWVFVRKQGVIVSEARPHVPLLGNNDYKI